MIRHGHRPEKYRFELNYRREENKIKTQFSGGETAGASRTSGFKLCQIFREENLAGSTGFEPAIFALTGRRVNQLHHDPAVIGIGYQKTAPISTGFLTEPDAAFRGLRGPVTVCPWPPAGLSLCLLSIRPLLCRRLPVSRISRPGPCASLPGWRLSRRR